jgi:hypothetical protein
MNIIWTKTTTKQKQYSNNTLIFNPKNYQLKTKGMLEQSGLQNYLLSFQKTKPQT